MGRRVVTADVLRPACELAFAVARAGAEAPEPVEPPPAMRSFLYSDELPRRAIAAAQQAIEENSEFRYRVALRADEAEIGRAGYLWLRRPPEWAAEFEALTAQAGDLPDTEIGLVEPIPTGDPALDVDLAADIDLDADLLSVAVTTSELEPDPEADLIEGVYQSLMAQPIELVSAQPPEPDDSLNGGRLTGADGPLASVTSLTDAAAESSFSRDLPTATDASSSLGLAAVTDTNEAEILSSYPTGLEASANGGDLGGADPDFEADALESELASLRGLVERLANERDTVVGEVVPLAEDDREVVVSSAPPVERPEEVPTVDHEGLRADLDAAHHELYLSQADLTIARQEREEAQRQHSEALKRQVQLEKELAAVRGQKADLESQLTSNQARVISVEERFGRVEGQLTDVEREREVIKSQLETMTLERNQIRDERSALRVERDELRFRLEEVDDKTGGQDLVELVESHRTMSEQLTDTSRELDRMVAQAEQYDERVQRLTTEATDLKAERLDLRSRLGEVETSLDVVSTQYDALKIDAERNAADLGALRAERDGLQTQLADLQGSLSEVLSDQADTRQRNDTDRKALNELRVERDVMLARLADLEEAEINAKSRIDALVLERDELLSGRDELLDERGQLRAELTSATADRVAGVEQVKATEGRLGTLETELQVERRQREELGNRLIEFDQLAERVEQEKAALLDQRDQMAARVETLEAEWADAEQLRSERDALAAELAATREQRDQETTAQRSEIEQLVAERDDLQANRDELDERLSAALNELGGMEIRLGDTRRDHEELVADRDDLASELEQHRQVTEGLERQLVELRAAVAEADQAAEETNVALQVKESELRTVLGARSVDAAELDRLRGDLAAVKAEVEERQGTGEQLESDLAVAQSSLAAVQSEADDDLSRLRDELARARVELATANAELEAHLASAPPAVPPSLIAEVGSGDELDSMAAEVRSTLRGPTVLDSLVGDAPVLDDGSVGGPVDDGVDFDEATLRLAGGAAGGGGPAGGGGGGGGAGGGGGGGGAGAAGGAGSGDTAVDEDVLAGGVTEPVDDDLIGPAVVADGGRSARGLPSTEPGVDEAGDLAPTAADSSGEASPDDDDLDLVSELISQTVSGFAGDGLVDLRDYQEPDIDLGAELARNSADGVDADGAAIPSSPPSLLGEAAGRARPAEQPDLGVRRPGGAKRRRIEVPDDITDDEVAVARFVVSSPDVVLLVDGDSVAQLGWPKLPVIQQRDALVTYLADLSASSGAAPDVVFDGRLGDGDSLPASRAVRIRLSTPPTPPTAALDELVDAYPEQWPIALVTDDRELASTAAERGAAVLNNGQLLDLFIAE